MEVEVIIGVGSNVAQRSTKVAEAIEWLNTILSDMRASHIYTTSPYQKSGSDYSNAVVSGMIDVDADKLENMLKEYESSNGRSPEAKLRGEVPIDLDLVFYNGECLRPREISRDYFMRGAQYLIDRRHPSRVSE